MTLMWYVPFDGPHQFVRSKPHPFEERMALSPTLFILYNINKEKPNPHLSKFGYVLANIPGDALFISEGPERQKNISKNIEEELPKILEEDDKQRNSFYQWFQESGGAVINLQD